MIGGTVNARSEAIVRLRVRGPSGAEVYLNSIIETGFTASLTLPPAIVTRLGLVRHTVGNALLADGSTRMFDIYAAEVEWGGEWRPLLVWAVDSDVLLGTRLLAQHQLRIEVVPGGQVEITPIR